MADDPNLRGARDRARIDVHQQHELRHWSQKFGVSEDELRKAVEAVGPMVDDVERQLRVAASMAEARDEKSDCTGAHRGTSLREEARRRSPAAARDGLTRI